MKPYKTRSRINAKPTRWIDGLKFTFLSFAFNKEAAQSAAKELRKVHDKVRAIKQTRYYAIYIWDDPTKPKVPKYPIHQKCGREMRPAILREMTKREQSGDCGKIWICDHCGVKVHA